MTTSATDRIQNAQVTTVDTASGTAIQGFTIQTSRMVATAPMTAAAERDWDMGSSPSHGRTLHRRWDAPDGAVAAVGMTPAGGAHLHL